MGAKLFFDVKRKDFWGVDGQQKCPKILKFALDQNFADGKPV